MKYTIFLRNLIGVVALVCLLAFSASAQTTLNLSIQRLADQKLHIYATVVNGGTPTQLLTGSQVTIMAPAGSLATSVAATTTVSGSWAYQGKQTDGTNDYLLFVLTSEYPSAATALTPGSQIELFNIATTGSCTGGNISINTTPTQIVNSNEVGTAILSSDNGGGSVNAVVGYSSNAVPCQSFVVANSTVGINGNSGTPIASNVGTAAGVSGGSGTYTYTAVQCAAPNTASTTTANGGTVTVNNATGALSYTSATGFSGTDTFCVNVCDGPTCQLVTYNVNVASTCPPFTLPTLSK